MKIRFLLLLMTVGIFLTGCESPQQRRFVVYDRIACNLSHVNNKIEAMDRFGFHFGAVFGYKTDCSNSKDFKPFSGQPLMTEAEAISVKCDQGGGIMKADIDKMLSLGATIVSSNDTSKYVDIFYKDGEVYPSNQCFGREYIIQVRPSVVRKVIGRD